MIHFDLPKDKSSILKVIGVGGGGSNAVNHMQEQHIEGVNFVVCNTDAQAIASSKVPNKVQLGPNLTQGLGAGANPTVGKEATEESLEEIKRILEVNTKMAFITAGMGGGTGTGGAPIVAKICKQLGILTVGIVTTPFGYEGRKRMEQAKLGIESLKESVDTLLVINNDKLRHKYGNLKMSEAFAKADNILATAAKCIVDVINVTGQINVDFADVCTVMRNGGVAILGNAAVAGENRAQTAVEEALNSPLLNDNDIRGAKWILLNITSAEGEHEHTMDEVEIINQFIVDHAGEGVDIIMGQGYDNSLGDKVAITLIATGFEQKENFSEKVLALPKEEKIVMQLQPAITETAPVAQAEVVNPIAAIVEEKKEEETKLPELQLVEPIAHVPTIKLFDEPTVTLTPAVEEKPIVHEIVLPKPDAPIRAEATEQPVALQSFLAKPNTIYQPQQEIDLSQTTKDAETKENTVVWDFSNNNELPPLEITIKPNAEMGANQRMQETESTPVHKQNSEQPVIFEEPNVPSVNISNSPIDEGADRTKKLRSLSFNYNNADSDELENVPAYVRRQSEIHNTLAKVEKFYSDYTVNVDENNQAQINVNSKNSFLEGQRPD